MNPDQELGLMKNRIIRDAKARGIDLLAPANAFTVWADYPEQDRMVYLGNYLTHSEAAVAVAEHPRSQKVRIYIAMWSAGDLAIYEV